ncbi:MAG TPA: PQQ-binding-like beta-propeller repeat protein [Vicinamibacteria bacterium]|nr:PQQ-binding-like beta-propeller repeat protein [Vicinamibacteria bacterium]
MVTATALTLSLLASPSSSAPGAPVSVAELAGTWAGTLTHAGETEPFALELEPGTDGKVLLKMSVPVAHLDRAPIGRVAAQVQGEEVRLGPFVFRYDREAKTLTGTAPKDLVPVYEIPLTLRRVERFDVPPRPEIAAPLARPSWTFEAASPLWAGATFARGTVYAGGQDGQLHALDARTGTEKWSFRAGGPIRTRAALDGATLYFQADDGQVYALDAASGRERWRARVVEKPIERLPFDNPKSRYDRFGSDVTVAGGRLYLGTHDGRVLALDPARGEKAWEFASGDSVLAAPAVDAGLVFFGSFDAHVYALDAGSGKLLWKRDARAPVVSTPAVAGDRVVVGNRGYDLTAYDARTGEPAWTRYIWFSWVESSAVVRDGVAYVGSSDAAAVYAFDARTGERRWKTDVFGWAWGQPAVTDRRVYAGTASQKDYLAGHEGMVVAMDRSSGRPVWHYVAEPAAKGPYGFPGSPAVGEGRVFVTGLDGKVYAFDE